MRSDGGEIYQKSKQIKDIDNKIEYFIQRDMHKATFLTLLLFAATLGVVGALELARTEEGSCRGVENIPTHQDVDPNWLDSLRYITGGSKFQLYKKASSYPAFKEMREFEFYYNACLYKNVSFAEGRGTQYGFGGVNLGEFDIEPVGTTDPRAIVDATPIDPQTGTRSPDIFRIRVTLTDYRTFAVLHNCFQGPNQDQKAWDVYSVTPELDEKTQALIENHVQSIGFKRENIIFMQRGKCQYPDRPVSNRPQNIPPGSGPNPLPGKIPGVVGLGQPRWESATSKLQNEMNAKNDIPAWGVNRLKTLTPTNSPTVLNTVPPVVLEKSISQLVLNKYIHPVVLNKDVPPVVSNKYVPPVVLSKKNPSDVLSPGILHKQTDSSKYIPPVVLNRFKSSMDSSKQIPPEDSSIYTSPIDLNNYVAPVASYKNIHPVHSNKHASPVDSSIYSSPVDSSKYVAPVDSSKSIPPVFLRRSTAPIVLKKGNPVEPTPEKEFTMGQQDGRESIIGVVDWNNF